LSDDRLPHSVHIAKRCSHHEIENENDYDDAKEIEIGVS
jgi:hypothetical protein